MVPAAFLSASPVPSDVPAGYDKEAAVWEVVGATTQSLVWLFLLEGCIFSLVGEVVADF